MQGNEFQSMLTLVGGLESKMISLQSEMQDILVDRPVIPWGEGSNPTDHPFQCSINKRDPVPPETDPVDQVSVASGYVEIEGRARVLVPSTDFDLKSGGSVYIVYTRSSHSFGSLTFGRTPPDSSATALTIVIADVTSGGKITQRHWEDILVSDIRGTPALYKVAILREYDANHTLIAIGSETGGAGRYYWPTWDYVRAH